MFISFNFKYRQKTSTKRPSIKKESTATPVVVKNDKIASSKVESKPMTDKEIDAMYYDGEYDDYYGDAASEEDTKQVLKPIKDRSKKNEEEILDETSYDDEDEVINDLYFSVQPHFNIIFF